MKPLNPGQGAALTTREGLCPSTPRRVFDPFETLSGIPLRTLSLQGSRRMTDAPRLLFCCAKIPRLRTRPKGFAIALWKPSPPLPGMKSKEELSNNVHWHPKVKGYPFATH